MEDIFEDPIMDIDSCDAKNPLAGVDYVDDLYGYYRKMEVKTKASALICQIYMNRRLE